MNYCIKWAKYDTFFNLLFFFAYPLRNLQAKTIIFISNLPNTKQRPVCLKQILWYLYSHINVNKLKEKKLLRLEPQKLILIFALQKKTHE